MVTTLDTRHETARPPGAAERLHLTCTLAGQRYLLTAGAVREVEEIGAITPVPATSPWLRGVMNLRGTIIAVVDLAHFLGLSADVVNGNEALICAPGTGERGAEDDLLLAIAVESVSTIRMLDTTEILPLPERGGGESAPYLRGYFRAAAPGGATAELLGVLDLDAVLRALLQAQQEGEQPY